MNSLDSDESQRSTARPKRGTWRKNPIEVFSLRLFVRSFPENLRLHYSFFNDADLKDGDG